MVGANMQRFSSWKQMMQRRLQAAVVVMTPDPRICGGRPAAVEAGTAPRATAVAVVGGE
jgi:hypothetical protein